VRTWSHGTTTSAYAIGMVTPLLAPGFIATAFAVTVEQKRGRLLHTELISRLVPEWSEVPFVGVSTGKSTAARVWDGDGVRVIAHLLDTAHGSITQLVRRDAVEKMLTCAVRGDRPTRVHCSNSPGSRWPRSSWSPAPAGRPPLPRTPGLRRRPSRSSSRGSGGGHGCAG
jgi:hypothetical protein